MKESSLFYRPFGFKAKLGPKSKLEKITQGFTYILGVFGRFLIASDRAPPALQGCTMRITSIALGLSIDPFHIKIFKK